jgi:hypothetical protein
MHVLIGSWFCPGLNKLEDLNLSFTSVTDNGLKRLSGLTNLKSLNLDARQITDAGLANLTSKCFLVYLLCLSFMYIHLFVFLYLVLLYESFCICTEGTVYCWESINNKSLIWPRIWPIIFYYFSFYFLLFFLKIFYISNTAACQSSLSCFFWMISSIFRVDHLIFSANDRLFISKYPFSPLPCLFVTCYLETTNLLYWIGSTQVLYWG